MTTSLNKFQNISRLTLNVDLFIGGGSPGIIIGNEFMPGAISYDKLKATVAEVRDDQNQHKDMKEKD